MVTTDRASGKSKGYGFITYRYAANAAAAVAEPEKQLDVRTGRSKLQSSGRPTCPLVFFIFSWKNSQKSDAPAVMTDASSP